MKKNIFSALICALAILTVAACNKPEENFGQQERTHTVTFKAQVPSASETKTAVMLKLVPDWRNTDVNDVHIFEIETSASGTAYPFEATKVKMTSPVDGTWEKAYFYAEFDNATVIVNPPTALTKAGSTFDYTAIMATRVNDKYLVPSVQYPHVESLIDPKADFLVANCPTSYTTSRHEQRVYLDFYRPVALSRLAVTNLEGSVVESVKISCAENNGQYNGIISGEAAYSDIDFETRTAEFQPNESSYELNLLYPDGLKRSGTTYLYLVTVPGVKSIKSVEVVTDKYIYTKSFSTPASLTFYASEFINIAMDMTVKEGGNVTRVAREALEMEYEDLDGQPVSEITYDLYENAAADFGAVAPSLYIAVPGSAGELTFSSSNEDVATVDESGEVTLTGIAGEATITASASGDGHQYMATTASYKIIVTNSAPEVTYYKANTVDAGYEYMIVSAANALRLNGGNISAVEVTVDEEAGTVSLEPVEGILWTAAAASEALADYGTHTFSQGSSNLTRFSDSGSYQLVASEDALDKYMVWNYDGTNFWNISIYESTVTDFYAYFNEGWRIASSGYGATALYTTRRPQEIAFANPTVSYDLYTDASALFTGQTVSDGAKTDVTYSIDNTAVATINPANGAVEVVGKGVAVITATAAASDTWQSAVATYTLTVTDSTPAPVGATQYVKVTSVSDLEIGANYLLVFEGLEGDEDDADPKVFYPVLNSGKTQFVKDASSSLDVTIDEGVITSDDFADCELTLEEGYFFKAVGADNYYIYPTGTSGGSGTLNAEASAATALSIAFEDGIAEIKANSGSNYFVWSVSSHYFSSNATISGQYSTGICLYMLNDGRSAQSISFSADEAAYDVYAGAWEEGKGVPALDGAQTDVTYSSSNESVATVDASTGAVTIAEGVKKGDKAVITATAEKDATWRAAKASYTITITSSDPSVPVYTKVLSNDDIEEDAQYILVYESASKAFKPILASSGSNFTKSSANAIDVDIVNNTIASADLDDCLITFEEGKYLFIESAGDNGKYLYPGASGDSALGAENKTESHTVSISIASDGIATIARSSDATYHLYWSSSNYFSGISQTGSSYAANICLYKLDDGRTPQSMSFSSNEAEYDVFVNDWVEGKGVPALGGNETDVTYASSNVNVATVDPASGAVTIVSGVKKGDKAVITATAEANSTFKKGKASYTINIVNSNPAKVMYSKVTSTDEIVADGSYVFVYRNGSTVKAFKPVLNSGKTAFQQAAANAIDVTIVDDQIDSEDVEGCEIVLTNQDGTDAKFSMVVPAADGTNDYYFVLRNNSSSFVASTSETGYRSTFAISSGALSIKRDSYNFRYSSSSNYFQASTSSASNLELFKLDDNQPKKRNLAFSASEVSVNIYGQSLPYAFAGAPTLSGKTDGVTYSVTCSDASVAASAYPTVSAAGAVTINGTGVFTVKASAPATAELQAGEASYTLTVKSEAAPTYTLIEGDANLVSGTYVIADKTDTYILNASNSNNGGYSTINSTTGVSKSGSTITLASDIAEAHEFVITRTGDNITIKKVGGDHAGQYLFASTSVTNSYMGFQSSSATFVINPQTGTDCIYFSTTKSSSNPTEYLYKKSSDSFFKLGGSGAPGGSDAGVLLYKKN